MWFKKHVNFIYVVYVTSCFSILSTKEKTRIYRSNDIKKKKWDSNIFSEFRKFRMQKILLYLFSCVAWQEKKGNEKYYHYNFSKLFAVVNHKHIFSIISCLEWEELTCIYRF